MDTFVTHALSADGFDASEDGTGRGTPIIVDGATPAISASSDYDDWAAHPHGDRFAVAPNTQVNGEEVASTLRGFGHGWQGQQNDTNAVIVAFSNTAGDTALSVDENTSPPMTSRHGDPGMIAFTQNQNGDVLTGDVAASMGTNQNATGRNTPKVAALYSKGNGEAWEAGDISPQLSSAGGGQAGQGYQAARIGMQVRRLTPRECERLQGFPDDYTLIEYRGRPASDGPRYRALGNSFAVPVIRWLGQRIAMVEKLCTR